MKNIKSISGTIVDVLNSRIFPGTLDLFDGRITAIKEVQGDFKNFIIPGFIDSHIHIESSMLSPSEFSRIASVHGTVAVVSDPHEIANVLGVDGVMFMIEDSGTVPLKFYFGAPSSVPATPFETSGAVIGPEEVERLLSLQEVKYLAEVMNFPGVIHNDPDIMKKIDSAKKYSKRIDGHAPGLRGKDLEQYVHAGISTDHESLARDEALEKIELGMKILIREGSAARDFEEMIPLLEKHADSCMFCSDDKHPDDLINSHINNLVKRAVNRGIDAMKILRVACVNPVIHYGLNVGLLRKGDPADFLIVDNLKDFTVLSTCINGNIVAENGRTVISHQPSRAINNFVTDLKKVSDFIIPFKKNHINVIEAIDGQLITNRLILLPKVIDGNVISDVEEDILKIAVVNRYRDTEVALGFVKNFGLKKGALASSIAHDSHNIVAVGVTDEALCRAVNSIIESKGGISAVSEEKEILLPLPIAGLMSNDDYSYVAKKYSEINDMACSLGSTLRAPFMTLSFMALLVIPTLKLSDKGLFDGEKFGFTDLFLTD